MNGERIRVAIVAPTLAGRIGLQTMLQSETAIEVVAEAARIEALYDELDQADLLLLLGVDKKEILRLPEGVEEQLALLWMSDDPDAAAVLRKTPCRAWGIVQIDGSEEELATAIYGVNQGFVVAPAWFLEPLWEEAASEVDDVPLETLTPRESEVLQLVAQGLANKQIGLEMEISEHTVKFHISSIYAKLGATNRAEAVSLGLRFGWITL